MCGERIMDLGVADQGFLIVGGTAGMGRAAAEVLAAEGARVAIAGRDPERARAAADAVTSQYGAKVVPIVGDVSKDANEAERIVAEAVASIGELAGVAVTTGTNPSAHSTLEDASDAIWQESFDETLMGTVRVVKAALPGLVARGGGTIVTTAAYSIHSPHSNRMPYVSLKSAVAAFTKNVAKSYGAQGVRANCVCPGAIETDGLAAIRTQIATARGVPEEGVLEQLMREEWHMDVALGRPGRPEEVGDLFAFLLSGRAGYLTGALLNIDGGTDF
jgi:NAD(P)-dependent dehydrogenase (short-subunit alcohol dehydrogenase family)